MNDYEWETEDEDDPLDMGNKYIAIMFALDGEDVTDYHGDSIESVWQQVSDGGSRWFFYPMAFVIRLNGTKRSWRINDNQRIVSAPDLPIVRELKGKTIKTVRQWIKDNNELLIALLS